MSNNFDDYGEPEVKLDTLLVIPNFPKAGRKERNYNADKVDEYLNKLIPVCEDTKDALEEAQHAYAEKNKQYDLLSEKYNDMALHVESGGVYDATAVERHLPENEVTEVKENDLWNDTSEEKNDTRVEELTRELEKVRYELEQEKDKNKNLITTDVANVNNNMKSDVDKASAIIAQAAKTAQEHVKQAEADAYNIKEQARKDAEALMAEETQRAEKAQDLLSEAMSSLNGIKQAHLEEIEYINKFFDNHTSPSKDSSEESKGKDSQDEIYWDELDEFGVN